VKASSRKFGVDCQTVTSAKKGFSKFHTNLAEELAANPHLVLKLTGAIE
jgi:hypothetical protein